MRCGGDARGRPGRSGRGGRFGSGADRPGGLGSPGGRRAGLTSHQFQPRLIGQEQRVHTGWLESDGSDRVQYVPHTKAGYRLPTSKLAFILATGSIAFRMKKAREAGVAN